MTIPIPPNVLAAMGSEPASDAGGDAGAPAHSDAPVGAAPTEPPAPTPEPAPELVPLPQSRRQQKAAQMDVMLSAIKGLETQLAELKSTAAAQAAPQSNQADIARLEGMLQAALAAGGATQQPKADPFDPFLNAVKAGDADAMKRALLEGVTTVARGGAPAPEPRDVAMESVKAVLELQHPKLAADIHSNPAAASLVDALFLQGVKSGLSRTEAAQKAFEVASQRLGHALPAQGGPSRAVVAATSGVGGAAGPSGGSDSVALPQGWRDFARSVGMSESDYASAYATLNPDSVRRGS